MNWKLEIYRAFFVAFGAMEVFTNLCYLTKKDGLQLARKQHQELPKSITEHQIRLKVILMFLFGLTFLINGLFSYYTHTVNTISFKINLILFSLYAFTESMYYKYWKTIGFFIVSMILLILFCI